MTDYAELCKQFQGQPRTIKKIATKLLCLNNEAKRKMEQYWANSLSFIRVLFLQNEGVNANPFRQQLELKSSV